MEQINELSRNYDGTEQELVKIKLSLANLDLENDELAIALNKKN